jgi:mRNA interferase RelE/StbE
LSAPAYMIKATTHYQKEFNQLPREVQLRISDAIAELGQNPHKFPLLKGKFKGLRKMRIGDYRVLYMVDDAKRMVVLVAVNERGQVYSSM